MTSTIKNLARQSLKKIGLGLYYAGLANWVIHRSSRTRAVLYHAVENESGSYTKGLGINVPPDKFGVHLDYYARFYNVISMSEYLASSAKRSTDSADDRMENKRKPRLLITFDDGYASVQKQALPLLEKHNMSATVYLIGNAVRGRMIWVNRLNQAINEFPEHAREVLDAYPGYPGLIKLPRRRIIHYIQTHFEPDQIDELMERLESSIAGLTIDTEHLFSTPSEIRQMQKRGIEFGFHSNEHYNLGRCTDTELAVALTTDGLEDLLNSNTFAYPFGYFSASAIGRLKRQGYKLLLTVGSNNARYSDLHLDRTEMFEPNFAHMFARLEVEEPFISFIRQWVHRCRSRMHGFSKGEFRRAV